MCLDVGESLALKGADQLARFASRKAAKVSARPGHAAENSR